ncbi:RING-H2 finger protein ATL74-like isoform X2 [Lycium barbarum]|uniref:RING-H2 finger protein ATL74-like isoform X2 n=1 Tax=Lycium barbarum TaxID=112863 RepID=UPI00293EB9DB|nr:RING-H2 finger protein ATL74-like isoform X2 [Lycium barbarum]
MEVYHRPYRVLLDPHPVIPPSSTVSKPHHGYSNEANFDTNMVIILAALLCALICALGLNSIVRCALRCSRRFAFESENATAARLAVTGLKKSTLRQLPVTVYGSGVNIPATDCPICLGEFMDGEKVRVLPRCHHGFHVKCIDIWLALHSSCPTCRQSLMEQNTTTTSGDVETGLRQPGTNANATATATVVEEMSMVRWMSCYYDGQLASHVDQKALHSKYQIMILNCHQHCHYSLISNQHWRNCKFGH